LKHLSSHFEHHLAMILDKTATLYSYVKISIYYISSFSHQLRLFETHFFSIFPVRNSGYTLHFLVVLTLSAKRKFCNYANLTAFLDNTIFKKQIYNNFIITLKNGRLCGLVIRVLDYRSRGLGFDSRALQKKSSGSGTGSFQPREYN
jgi:hypothetical protein